MPYNLLLTSTISLTPDVIRRVCATNNWTKFCHHLYEIGIDSDDSIDLLTEHVGIHNSPEGYQALAHLIKEGYFSTILTTNLDSTLEDTLLEAGLGPDAFQTLIVGRDQDEYIARILDGDHTCICIIKLHGSLRERVLPRQYPNFFDLPFALRESVGHYLNRDIVIVGSIEHDEDIVRVVNANNKSRVYYAIPRKSSRDTIIRLIKARGDSVRTTVISGFYGKFTSLFQALELMLISTMPTPHVALPALPIPERLQQTASRDEIPVADVLLVTVTEIEAKAVLACCSGNERRFIGKRVYYNLGVIGGARIFMAQSEMGSGGLGGSRFTVEEGIRDLSPSVVIMVGIAFGVDKEKQHMGDILIARQLEAYDPQRVGSDQSGRQNIYQRGNRVPAPPWLLDRCKAGLKTWQEPPYVHFGLVLSGEKLIDNQDYRDQLQQSTGEAIGGEMEGVGLYETTQRHDVGWLLVKAISDWADGNKHEDKDRCQQEAAHNAASFVMHVIQQGGFSNVHIFK